MFAVQEISVDSWVQVDRHCEVACNVVDRGVQFQFGEARSSVLYLIVPEGILEKMAHMSTDALRRIRAESDAPEHAENKTGCGLDLNGPERRV